MSDYRIKVTTSELRDAINKFNTCKDELAMAYGQMSTEVLALNSTWNGDASVAFVDRFSEMVTNIRTSDATIEQAVKGLQVAADEYDAAEEETSGWLESMPDASPFNG